MPVTQESSVEKRQKHLLTVLSGCWGIFGKEAKFGVLALYCPNVTLPRLHTVLTGKTLYFQKSRNQDGSFNQPSKSKNLPRVDFRKLRCCYRAQILQHRAEIKRTFRHAEITFGFWDFYRVAVFHSGGIWNVFLIQVLDKGFLPHVRRTQRAGHKWKRSECNHKIDKNPPELREEKLQIRRGYSHPRQSNRVEQEYLVGQLAKEEGRQILREMCPRSRLGKSLRK